MNPQSTEDACRNVRCSPVKVLPRAEAIRSKLVCMFYLVDHLQGLSQATPRHYIKDFLDPRKQRKLLLADHNQLVRFNISPIRKTLITPEKHLCSHIDVRSSPWPPLALWASWLLRSMVFRSFIIFLIFLNTFVLMIKSELMKRTSMSHTITTALEVAVWVIAIIFIIDIALNWLVSFRGYWKSGWNIFDFTITFVSLIPEFLYLFHIAEESVSKRVRRVFRILRSLKLFCRFQQVRRIIMAIAKALKAMTYILLFLLVFFYVFAVSGVFFFENYTHSHYADRNYKDYFSSFSNAVVTVFILFTMDHWYDLLQDTWKIPNMNKFISGTYIILWLLIGSFLFKNIIVAIMVSNFQTIRSEQIEEVQQIETQKQETQPVLHRPQELTQRLCQGEGLHHSQRAERRPKQDKVGGCSYGEGNRASASPDTEALPPSVDWETYIHENLQGLIDENEDVQVVWPRDSLFRYLELLEQLQYNLEDRKKLQKSAVLTLMNLENK
ncbi:cation channel sperm-associated protein 2 [Struthio camelus]|uniref:cation channel sperm-associated protein 2 n=1 Tax=Struthio camelus TaxID=8801 RepID=UPI003603D416